VQAQLRASRLDRFYVADELLPYVVSVGVASRVQLADHRMVVLALQAQLPLRHGPGLRRARVRYAKHADLWQRVEDFISRSQPPSDDAAVLAWWVSFKQQWLALVAEVDREARWRSLAALRGQQQARAAVDEASAALERGEAGASQAYEAAVMTLQQCTLAAAGSVALGRRLAWLHTRETPSPQMSRMVRPPAAATAITALRCPQSGGLVSGPAALPAAMAAYWKRVCSPRPLHQQARAAVLAAVAEHSRRIDPAAAAEAGSPDVTASEVAAALQRLPPGTAPGPDGLPVFAYRQHASSLAPILARVFSVVGASGAAPPELLRGAICFFYKKGDRADPANYRPITLLNADYRVLARALATRLGKVLAQAIDPSQCAFLPGRRMGEAVWLLQLLPYLMRKYDREAVLLFLDFAKAYDTVDRSFLFAVMEAVGAGDGMLLWARALLTNTAAVAVVNGYPSAPVRFEAGVRQGCPLSPLLYLFVGQALLAWLKQRQYGITVAGCRITAVQYADDCTPVLDSLADVHRFDDDMRTFRDASGQGLNNSKVQMVRIGRVRAQLPAHLPYPVVLRATTLGVIFANEALPTEALVAFWRERLAGVYTRYDKLSRMPLSVFGRGFGAVGYGISRLLYQMEFMGLPPGALLDELMLRTARLVDRSRSPTARGPMLVGVPAAAQPGRPADGGFGLLPLQQHVRARQAWWALVFVRSAAYDAAPAPWVVVATALLSACVPSATPLCVLTSLPLPPLPAGRILDPSIYGTRFPLCNAVADCPPLGRLVLALHCLGGPARVALGSPPLPLTVARDMPVWGNPLLSAEHGRLPPEVRFYGAFSCCSMVTVQDVWDAAPFGVGPGLPRQPSSVAPHERALLAALPPTWLARCSPDRRSPAEIAAARRASMSALLPLLQLLPAAGSMDQRPWRLSSVPSVQRLTRMQGDAAAAARAPRVRRFLQEASAPQGFEVRHFLQRQARMWQLPWDGRNKEVFWRLPLDGVALYGSARLMQAGAPPTPCWCGAGHVGREHCFWDCPVAGAVRASVVAALAAFKQPPPRVQRTHIWLAQPPSGVHDGAWQVVAMAALSAVEVGRRRLTATCLQQRRAGQQQQQLHLPPQQRLITDFFVPLPRPPCTRPRSHERASRPQLLQACTAAVTELWRLLRDFARYHSVRQPRGWLRCPLPRAPHPFLCATHAGGVLAPPPPDAAAAAVAAVTAVDAHERLLELLDWLPDAF
jgi:hypothetical protein